MRQYLFIAALLLFSINTYADFFSQDSKKLTIVNKNIRTVKEQLNYQHKARKNYQHELKSAETGAANARIKLTKISRKLHKANIKLQALKIKAAHFEKIVDTNRAKLAEQIKTAYMLNHAPFLKLLLNQQSAKHVSQLLMYDHYIAKKQAKIIATLRVSMNKLVRYRTASQKETTDLINLKTEQIRQNKKLTLLQHIRSTVVTQINAEIRSTKSKLRHLSHNKHSLEKTLKRLRKRLRKRQQKPRTKQPVTRKKGLNFAKLKGELPWPSYGKLLNYFGTKIYHSELTWSGILIKAPLDQQVRAIANGKVVFANWLPGYGLLLIINHGRGYMSLYGRNHTLNKKVGEKVKQGEVIAAIGKSGGYKKTALYFAIRHNAKPLNPKKWCY